MLRIYRTYRRAALVAALASAASACASQTRADTVLPTSLAKTEGWKSVAPVEPKALPTLGGSLPEYLAYALSNSPETRAAFESWRAARLRISRASRLPEPSISFGYYLRSVETKVGPQRYKIGISQTFPWPSKLAASEDAAAEKAAAASLMVDANVLAVKRKVARAYWDLWLIHEQHALKAEHDVILEALAGAVRGRLQTGAATLAELSQVDLGIARHHDHRGQHELAARKASARLRAAVGAVGELQAGILPIADAPLQGLPKTSEKALWAMSRRHPMVEKFSHLVASENHRVRVQKTDRYPRFKVGINLIGTGESSALVEDNGKDAVIVSAGLSVPLWGQSYSDSIAAARATSRSHAAMREAGLREAEAMLEASLADVKDAERRIVLYEKTLIPQAETVFQAVLGSYQIGRSTVAAVIIAQRDLIELRLQHAASRAQHAKAWASLEFVVAQELEVKKSQ